MTRELSCTDFAFARLFNINCAVLNILKDNHFGNERILSQFSNNYGYQGQGLIVLFGKFPGSIFQFQLRIKTSRAGPQIRKSVVFDENSNLNITSVYICAIFDIPEMQNIQF